MVCFTFFTSPSSFSSLIPCAPTSLLSLPPPSRISNKSIESVLLFPLAHARRNLSSKSAEALVNYDNRLRGSIRINRFNDHCLTDSRYFLLPLFHDYHLLSSIGRVSAQSCISWILCFGMQEVFHDSWHGPVPTSEENPPLILRSLSRYTRSA